MREPSATRRALLAALAAGTAAPAWGLDVPRRVTLLTRPGDDGEWLRTVLAERGYVDGANLRLTVVPVEGPPFEAAARAAIAAKAELLMTGGVERVRLLMGLTTTIPIICTLGSDVVGAGLAKSLQRPGRNVTGFSIEVRDIAPITISLAKAIRPRLQHMVVVLPRGPLTLNEGGMRPLAEAARAAGITWGARIAATAAQAGAEFADLPGERTAAFLSGGPQAPGALEMLAALNERRILTIAGLVMEWVEAGALMSYVRSIADKPRRIAALVDKLLRGVDPGTIPFEVGERAEFALNLKTAKAIGVAIPQEVLLRATRVIG